MRSGSFWTVGVSLALALALSGCMEGSYEYVGDPEMEDPHRFEGRLSPGDLESKRDEIRETLTGWPEVHIALQQQNTRATYKITVDGEESCEEAREKVGGLEFIRSRSDCAPVEL